MKQRTVSWLVVLITSGALILIEILTAGIISRFKIYPLLAIGMARIADIAAMVIIIVRWGNGMENIGLGKNKIFPGLLAGLAWAVGFGICALLLLGVMHVAGYNIRNLFFSSVETKPFSLILLFVIGGFVSPVAEEIFFRGIIYRYLRRWGAILAIVGSTLVFSLAHLLSTGLTPVQVIGGLVFAISYEIRKNLFVPITIHVMGNMAIFTLSLILAS